MKGQTARESKRKGRVLQTFLVWSWKQVDQRDAKWMEKNECWPKVRPR